MISNNLNINDNSMVPLNSINYKEYSTPGKFPLRTMQDSTQLLQQYGDGDEGVGGDDDDGDPDEVQLDGGVDGDDLPSPGRNFPRNFCLPKSSFSLCSFPPCRGGIIFLWLLP